MKYKVKGCVLVVFILCGSQSIGASPRDLPVESYVVVETSDINTRIQSAYDSGIDWPLDPMTVALEFIGSTQYRYVDIEKVDDVESTDNTIITIIRGGMLDDSVWGTWEQLHMSKNPNGIWQVNEARRAWRCYRGHQKESFGKRHCL